MRYRISPAYYRTQMARHLLWLVFLIAAVVASVYYLFQAAAVVDFILPVLGVAACSAYFIKLFQHVRQGRGAYAEIEFDPDAKVLDLIQGEETVHLDISHILNLRLQYRGFRLERVQITTAEGEVVRLEGYAELEALATELELLTPEGNVIRARMRIR